MSNLKQVLQQVLSDPYRSQADKDAARAQLDQLSGIVRERSELDKNANGLDRLAEQVANLTRRVEALEAAGVSPGPAATDEVAETIPPTKPPVEAVPQESIPDEGGQKQGRPKNRYQVEGERGNWGIRDRETGLYVWVVQNKRKDADKICRDLNAKRIEPRVAGSLSARGITIKTPLQREAEASVALDKDPDCGTQSIESQALETAEGTIPSQTPESGGKMYQTHEEKPAPEVRPDKHTVANAGVGRVPWYAK